MNVQAHAVSRAVEKAHRYSRAIAGKESRILKARLHPVVDAIGAHAGLHQSQGAFLCLQHGFIERA